MAGLFRTQAGQRYIFLRKIEILLRNQAPPRK